MAESHIQGVSVEVQCDPSMAEESANGSTCPLATTERNCIYGGAMDTYGILFKIYANNSET